MNVYWPWKGVSDSESSLCPAEQVTFTPDLSFCIWDSRECDFDISLAQPSSGSDLPCLCMILYSFQKSFTSILSSDSPCKCTLHRPGKISEPVLQTRTFFQAIHPIFRLLGFVEAAELDSGLKIFVYLEKTDIWASVSPNSSRSQFSDWVYFQNWRFAARVHWSF